MMNKPLTLGSLFDGSGGFPLGGLLAGITPVWASEIEPFPIRVTTKRLPFMKHYGNISAMDGGRIEPVDIITFGSPCQDMSVADRRDGLDGSRSSLFYEAVRIIKEMRCATGGRYPRFQTKGKSECAAKRIPEETLEVLTLVRGEGAGDVLPADPSWIFLICGIPHFFDNTDGFIKKT